MATTASAARGSTTAAFAAVTTLFFAWGFITSNNDPLIAAMRAIFALDYAEAMLTQFAFFIAYALLSLPAATLQARIGAVNAVLVALALMIVACGVAIGATRVGTYALVLVALFIMAGGITVLQVAANPLAAGLGDPGRSHFRLTLAQAFNSLGVVMGVHFGSRIMLDTSLFNDLGAHITDPAIRTAALGAVGRAYGLIALFLAVLGAFVFAMRRPIAAAAPAVGAVGGSVSAALADGWARFGALAIFLYVGAEVTIASIMINFLNRADVLGLPLETAGTWLANFYWGGALLGRFIGAWLLTRVPAPKLLAGVAVVASLLCWIALATSGPIAGYAALGVGLFNAIMFPTIFTTTLERARVPHAATSGLLCMAIVGGAVIPFVSGLIADGTSLGWALLLPAIAYLGIVAFAARAGRAPVHADLTAPVVSH